MDTRGLLPDIRGNKAAGESGLARASWGARQLSAVTNEKSHAAQASVARIRQIMEHRLNKLSRQYASELRKHLRHGPGASLAAARELGREAVHLGLETLDVARIHAGALALLEGASRDGIIKRAEIFFGETITPIEKTHGAAHKANSRLKEVHKRLDRRTVDLAITNRSLKRSIARRKSAQKALDKRGREARKLLEESRRLQLHLQRLTHRILSVQEHKRKQISHDLRDEIAQTLLGINVRLVSLKKKAAAEGLQKEIASTRQLVLKSMESIKGFARAIGNHDES